MTQSSTNKTSLICRAVLVAILSIIVASNYFSEYCAYCDGYGWDGGNTYRGMVINGLDEYLSGSISDYHTHRMLPFLVTHYTMKALSMPFTPANVMAVSSTINILLLAVAVWFFFKISIQQRWKPNTETIMFALAFFNFHVLKFMGYCPVMTDMPAFTLSMMLTYYFLKNNKAGIALTGAVSVVVFPLISLMALFAAILPRNPLKEYSIRRKGKEGSSLTNNILNAAMRSVLTLWLPAAFALYIFFRLYVKGVSDYQSVFIMRYPQSAWISAAGIAAYVIFYWFATKPLQVDFTGIFKPFRERRRLVATATAVILFVIIYSMPTLYGYKGKFSLVNELAQICQFPATDILIFIETPFLYLGLGFLLLMIRWKSVCRETMLHGTGAYAILLLALVFLADIETRKIICFYIFLLPMIGATVEKTELSATRTATIAAIQLLLSCFWFRINVAGTAEAFATGNKDIYMMMPAQRYYMFQGPWQSHEIYFTMLWIEIMFVFLYSTIFNKQKR